MINLTNQSASANSIWTFVYSIPYGLKEKVKGIFPKEGLCPQGTQLCIDDKGVKYYLLPNGEKLYIRPDGWEAPDLTKKLIKLFTNRLPKAETFPKKTDVKIYDDGIDYVTPKGNFFHYSSNWKNGSAMHQGDLDFLIKIMKNVGGKIYQSCHKVIVEKLPIIYPKFEIYKRDLMKRILKKHPGQRNLSLVPNNFIQSCDETHAKIYHKLATKILTQKMFLSLFTNIQANAHEWLKELESKGPLSPINLREEITQFYLLSFFKFFLGIDFSSPNPSVDLGKMISSGVNFPLKEELDNARNADGSCFTNSQKEGFIVSLINPILAIVAAPAAFVIEQWSKDSNLVPSIEDRQELNLVFKRHFSEGLRFSESLAPANPSQVSPAPFNKSFRFAKAIVGPDPFQFRPERYSDRRYFTESHERNWLSSPFMVFGFGPTMCVGSEFTKYLGVILLQELAANYHLKNVEGKISLVAKTIV